MDPVTHFFYGASDPKWTSALAEKKEHGEQISPTEFTRYTMSRVPTSDPAYRRIRERVLRTIPEALEIRVDEIQQRYQWRRYHHYRDEMKNSSTALNEIHLFHGYAKSKCDRILSSQHGLDPRYSNGGFYGKAIYAAETAAYVVAGNYAHQNDDGTWEMLVLRASLGTCRNMGSSVTADTRRMFVPGFRSCGLPYDSVKGGPHRPLVAGTHPGEDGLECSANSSVVYAIYDARQLYPEFRISFAKKPKIMSLPCSISEPIAKRTRRSTNDDHSDATGSIADSTDDESDYRLGDTVFFISSTKSFSNGEKVKYSGKGVVVGTPMVCGVRAVTVKFPWNKGKTRVHPSSIMKRTPIQQLSNGQDTFHIGSVVYYDGMCKTFEDSHDTLRYGEQGIVAGFTGNRTSSLAPCICVAFPWNKGNVTIATTNVSATPVGKELAGGFRLGEQVYYTGPYVGPLVGRAMYGSCGSLVGPGKKTQYHYTSTFVMIKFPWYAIGICVDVKHISRTDPGPNVGGSARLSIGEHFVYTGLELRFTTPASPGEPTGGKTITLKNKDEVIVVGPSFHKDRGPVMTGELVSVYMTSCQETVVCHASALRRSEKTTWSLR